MRCPISTHITRVLILGFEGESVKGGIAAKVQLVFDFEMIFLVFKKHER
jgi:hypothetical protein